MINYYLIFAKLLRLKMDNIILKVKGHLYPSIEADLYNMKYNAVIALRDIININHDRLWIGDYFLHPPKGQYHGKIYFQSLYHLIMNMFICGKTVSREA